MVAGVLEQSWHPLRIEEPHLLPQMVAMIDQMIADFWSTVVLCNHKIIILINNSSSNIFQSLFVILYLEHDSIIISYDVMNHLNSQSQYELGNLSKTF